MSRAISLTEKLLSAPDFSKYNGGDVFIFQEKIYRKHGKKLGNGAYGETHCFKADDDTQVAVKTELPTKKRYFFGDEFQKEANWYQKIYGLGVFSGDPKNYSEPHYILMPYFSGKTLYDLTYPTLKNVFIDWIKTANALHCLHDKYHGIHCDFKSDNIIVGKRADNTFYSTQETQVFLIDFGLAMQINDKRVCFIEDTAENKLRHQQYAPELFAQQKRKILAHPSQDIYSLGILLQELYGQFLSVNNLNYPDAATQETVNDVRINLTNENPDQRWPIAKAIYMLTITFFSQIPRQIWIASSGNVEFNKFNHDNQLRNIWRFASRVAIQARQDELATEQKILQRENKKSKRKEQKIGGLKLLQSEIKIKNPEALGLMIENATTQFPELTAGVFSRRTAALLAELTTIAPIFH